LIPCGDIVDASPSAQPSTLIEGSLEVKLPTIWTDEKQSREEAGRRLPPRRPLPRRQRKKQQRRRQQRCRRNSSGDE